MTSSSSPSSSTSEPTEATEEPTSRYLGQVVVPGAHISKIELEEFASQMKKDTQPQVVAVRPKEVQEGV